jgi:hypothetical protein
MKGFGWFLTEVEKIYIPGMISFYENMAVDPWQQNLDSLEAEVMAAGTDVASVESAAAKALASAQAMVTHFKVHGEQAKQLSLADSFMIGNPKTVRDVSATMQRVCYSCQSSTQLSIQAISGSARVRLVCKSCKELVE